MSSNELKAVQQLEDRDYPASDEFAQWCLQNTQRDVLFLNQVFCSGESVFHVDEKVKKHNVRIWVKSWGTKNCRKTRELARDGKKVDVWVAKFALEVFSPY